MKNWTLVAQGIKDRELQFEHELEAHLPIVIRLDGCTFKRFTDPLVNVKKQQTAATGTDDAFMKLTTKRESEGKRAFDIRFTRTMTSTAIDLVDHFNATLGYTISDEITIVIPPAEFQAEGQQQFDECMYQSLTERDAKKQNKKRGHVYNGRLSKINSICAAMATERFNYHFHNDHSFADLVDGSGGYPAEKQAKISAVGEKHALDEQRVPFPKAAHLGHFDARTMTVTTPQQVYDIIDWRQRFDGERNIVNRVGQYVYGHRQSQNKTRQQLQDAVWRELRLDILGDKAAEMGMAGCDGTDNDFLWYREVFGKDGKHSHWQVKPSIGVGVLVKREKFLRQAFNLKLKEAVVVERTRVVARAVKLTEYTPEFCFTKHWPQGEVAVEKVEQK